MIRIFLNICKIFLQQYCTSAQSTSLVVCRSKIIIGYNSSKSKNEHASRKSKKSMKLKAGESIPVFCFFSRFIARFHTTSCISYIITYKYHISKTKQNNALYSIQLKWIYICTGDQQALSTRNKHIFSTQTSLSNHDNI